MPVKTSPAAVRNVTDTGEKETGMFSSVCRHSIIFSIVTKHTPSGSVFLLTFGAPEGYSEGATHSVIAPVQRALTANSGHVLILIHCSLENKK